MADPRLVSLYQEVAVKFPLVRNGGIDNCRKISGSSTWSQHSWGKALDIMVPNLSYGDQVKRYIDGRKKTLGLGTILWRQKDHWDHLHVEVADKGTGIPPCAGGELSPTRLWGDLKVGVGGSDSGPPTSYPNGILGAMEEGFDKAFSGVEGFLLSPILRPMLGLSGLVMLGGGIYILATVYNVAPSLDDIKDVASSVL